jgi:hypothetical protein
MVRKCRVKKTLEDEFGKAYDRVWVEATGLLGTEEEPLLISC